jgi:hypothetical protein
MTDLQQVKVKAKNLLSGDVLSSGSTVLGVNAFVKGGVEVWVRSKDGEERPVVLNGRMLHTVTRS